MTQSLLPSFAREWWNSRRWWALLSGMSAVAAGVCVILIWCMGQFASTAKCLRTYREAALSALRSEDIDAADVYVRRVLSMNRTDPATIYVVARLAAAKQQQDAARALMQQIAPADAAGYPEAHFWLATDLTDRQSTPEIPKSDRLLEHHLKQALASPSCRVDADAMLGQLYFAQKEVDAGILHLEIAVARHAHLNLELAQLYALKGLAELVRVAAELSRDWHRKRVGLEPKEPGHRVRWAWSEVLLGDYQQARQVLEAGRASSDPKRLRSAMVAVDLDPYHFIVRTDPNNLTKQLDILDHAAKYGPENPHVVTLLADLATRDWENAGQADKTLKQLLQLGASSPGAHYILGTNALKQGDIENGLVHLEQALAANPQMPLALNNMAWGITPQDSPDLERALRLAQAAKHLSDHPEIAHTLGTILMKMGKYREAVAELRTALVKGAANQTELHETLANALSQLGETELAATHRHVADQIRATRPESH